MKKKTGKKSFGAAKILALVVAVTAVFLVCAVSWIIVNAPKIDVLDATPKGYRTNLLDSEGNTVLTLSGEESNRVYVGLDEMPEDLKNAFVAIEDERFYKHHGIDLRGIARAFFKGVKNGGFSEGASTITQQLIKNNVLESWKEERTFSDKVVRKLQEQYLAVLLEFKQSKDWILENYLNTINLGGGTWGVEAAAKYYFKKDVSELTLSECAILAAIPKSPTGYNPIKNPNDNNKRKNLVLSKMKEQGLISEEEYTEAYNDPVYERLNWQEPEGDGAEIMTYFEDACIYQIVDDLEAAGYSSEAAWDLLYKGGLTIYSTEDSSLQEICEEEMNRDSNYYENSQASMVMLDTATGQVKALVGGRGVKTASLIFNRATDSIRQPGSTLKIIGEYAAGLEKNAITLGTTFDDAPYSYSDGTPIANANRSYGGMTTVRNAIMDSNNIVALKCLQNVGIEAVYDQIGEFGITTLTSNDKIESLALGGVTNGVTNLEMTTAYSAIARGGEYIEPSFYTKVTDRTGNTILEMDPDTHEAVSEDTAALLTSAMESVIQYGTGTSAYFDGAEIAGKSGTTDSAKDAWFIGYSPYLTCGVWGGYDDPVAQGDSGYVKQLWKAAMSRAHEGLTYRSFEDLKSMETAVICMKCGKLAVSGLCDDTVQGDMTCKEYYVTGSAPTEYCDCHVKVSVDNNTGERSSGWKFWRTSKKVYLKTATAGTEDVSYVVPPETEQTHEGWFSSGDNNGWFSSEGDNNSGYSQDGSENDGWFSEEGEDQYQENDPYQEDDSYQKDDSYQEDQENGGWWNDVWDFGQWFNSP